jgi:hypothetical protein
VRTPVKLQLLLTGLALFAVSSCRSRRAKPAPREATVQADRPASLDATVKDDLLAEMRRTDELALERDANRKCERAVAVYEGSIPVAASDYVHSVARGDDFVDKPIDGLDRIVSKSARVQFTLDYPFEKPFAGVVTRDITLRRTIDAIRAGFRTMYEGTTQREIPGMDNKDVTGPYGRSFHAIEDLVIERIDLCDDESFEILIGS